DIALPPTAYTGDACASYQRGTLRVDMAAKDPAAPAMVEKAARDPDRPTPRELPLSLPGQRHRAPGHPPGRGPVVNTGIPMRDDPTGRGAQTPAQAEYGERNDELFGRPGVNAVMPQANLASTVVTDMPIITNPGAAVEAAADNGETVVVDPKSSETRIFIPKVDQCPCPPSFSTSVDYTEEKVGLATRPLEARDFYSTCESTVEPYSTVKAQAVKGDPSMACDMCRCAPCQCDKMAKNFPYELTPQEQKRYGKASVHDARKPVTGKNTHPAHDYKVKMMVMVVVLHSKIRSEEHAQVAFRTREFEGNVKMQGVGSLEDLPAKEREEATSRIVGGREIDPELIRDRTRTAEAARHFLG
ncbi:hypothetical protein VOLCADRAFT_118206, partial [Volvox carteri f. nagariensis]